MRPLAIGGELDALVIIEELPDATPPAERLPIG
jgi:hypothetical protein